MEKHTVVCGTPDFLGVVGACACNRYQALFPPFGPGYEAIVRPTAPPLLMMQYFTSLSLPPSLSFSLSLSLSLCLSLSGVQMSKVMMTG